MLRTAALTATFFAASLLAPAPKPDYKPPEGPNKNTLIEKHKGKIKMSASTVYIGWPAEKLIDGDPNTSWFSNTNDTVTRGTTPWVEVEFPEDVDVARVTILGNREPSYPKGYAILAGKLELFDKNGVRIEEAEGKGVGEHNDFEFTGKKLITGVRKVRFTSIKDEGDRNGSGWVGLDEIQIG